MKINITIPVWNEADTLKHTVPQLARFFSEQPNDNEFVIVIADNGSTDSTAAVAEEIMAEYPNVRYLYTPEKGRGNALIMSWKNFDSDLHAYIDADMDTDFRDFLNMIAMARQGYSIVVGSRVHPDSVIMRPWYRKFTSLWSNLLVRVAFNFVPTDTQCGFKLIDTKARDLLLPKIQDKGWFFDLELLLLARKHGLKICAVPVNDKYNRYVTRKSKVNLIKDSLLFISRTYDLKKRGL